MKQSDTLQVKISYSGEQIQLQEQLLDFVPGCFFMIGLLMMLNQVIPFEEEGGSFPALVVIGIMGVIIGLFAPIRKRMGQIGVALFALLSIVAGVVFHSVLNESMAANLNQVGAFLTRKSGYYVLPFETKTNGFLFLVVMILLLGILNGVLLSARFVLLQVAGLLLSLSAIAAGLLKADVGIAFLFAGILLILARNLMREEKSRLILTAALVAVFALFFGIISVSNMQINDSALSNRIHEKVHELRFEKHQNPMPEGKLRGATGFHPSKEEALTVTMKSWKPLYIKGYIGANYTEAKWDKLTEKQIEDLSTKQYQIQKKVFFPGQQIGTVARLLNQENQVEENEISIENKGACSKYTYLPYGVESTSILDPKELLSEGGTGGVGISYTSNMYDVSESYMLEAALAEAIQGDMSEGLSKYIEGENSYREIVYDTYTLVPKKTKKALQAHFDIAKTKDLTTSQLRSLITDWVDETLEYDESIGSSKEKEDYISYMLEMNPSGNSSQFATLATMLFRMAGVPARYVEGYLLPQKLTSSLPEGASFTVTEEYGYAWTEIYLEGIGWIPVDTTPDHADEVNYKLPVQSGAQNVTGTRGSAASNGNSKQKSDRQTQVDSADGLGEDDTLYNVLNLNLVIGILLLLLLLAFLTRFIVLRVSLRKRVKGFTTKQPKQGAADCYAYMEFLMSTIPNNKTENEAGVDTEEVLKRRIEELMKKEGIYLRDELWFSNHEFGEEKRKIFLDYLKKAKKIWKKRVSKKRQFFLKWIACNIY